MLKKIMGIMLAFVLTLSLTGCSFFEDDSSKGNSNTSDTSKDDSIKIKTVDDFAESQGLVKYFTINDYKFSIPETVGEYVNYLQQLGTVTLNETGKSVNDVELNAGGVSSMAAYLKVTTDDNKEARFYVRYENKTDEDIAVAEANITYLEIKYDIYSEFDYDKAFSDIQVVTDDYTFKLNDKKGFSRFFDVLGNPNKNIDGRLDYSDDLGYNYTFDCCNENRSGIFRGFIIKYPTQE